ncbi:MAG: hypothetical protein WC349_02030 [Patescibacteria group bacterium]|jgi:uncharacterized membrane protein (DUF106 family)
MSIFDMITFRELNAGFFVMQVILFSLTFLVVNSKKAVSIIKKLANNYYPWLKIIIFSIIVGVIVYIYNKSHYRSALNEDSNGFFKL